MGIDDIPVVDKAQGFDASKYEGRRVKIAKVEEIEVIDFYPDGETYNPNSTEKVHKIEIETEPLREIDDKGNFTDKVLSFMKADGSEKKVTVNARFALQKDDKGIWVISKHPKAQLWAFMRKMGAIKLSDLTNNLVTLTVQPSKKPGDDRKFLRIVI